MKLTRSQNSLILDKLRKKIWNMMKVCCKNKIIVQYINLKMNLFSYNENLFEF